MHDVSEYTRKNSSGWCNIVRWTTPKQCHYQGSTTLVELTMLMSIVRSIVVRCWQRTIIVVGTRADNSWWKKLVDGCQQWLNNNCWPWTTVNNGCWRQLLRECSTTLLTGQAQHCNKLLTTLIKLFILTRVDLSYNDVKCGKIHVTLNMIGSTFFQSQSNFVWHLESAFDVIMRKVYREQESQKPLLTYSAAMCNGHFPLSSIAKTSGL